MSVKHNFKKSTSPTCTKKPNGEKKCKCEEKSKVLRRSYTTKKGTKVPSRCIKTTSMDTLKTGKRSSSRVASLKESVGTKEYFALQKVKKSGKKYPKSCPEGEILRKAYERKAYTRKDGVKVKASVVAPGCIKDRGAEGKGPKAIVIDPKDRLLSNAGYKKVKDLTVKERHSILKGLVERLERKYGARIAYNSVIQRLNSRANLLVRTSPENSRIFKEDMNYISKMYKKHKLRQMKLKAQGKVEKK